jgi:hypothetical protein
MQELLQNMCLKGARLMRWRLEHVGRELALLLAKFKDAQKEVLNGDGVNIAGDA